MNIIIDDVRYVPSGELKKTVEHAGYCYEVILCTESFAFFARIFDDKNNLLNEDRGFTAFHMAELWAKAFIDGYRRGEDMKIVIDDIQYVPSGELKKIYEHAGYTCEVILCTNSFCFSARIFDDKDNLLGDARGFTSFIMAELWGKAFIDGYRRGQVS